MFGRGLVQRIAVGAARLGQLRDELLKKSLKTVLFRRMPEARLQTPGSDRQISRARND